MNFHRCQFLKSAQAPADFPPETAPEIAFAGRSNAGKSSALNALTRQSALARVSKTPGRTQLINFFELDGARLVDLPGYGYAKVPGAMREQWRGLIGSYLEQRANLRGVVVLMDSRHPLTELDRQLLAWLQALGIPALVLLTKSDKLSRSAAEQVLRESRQAIRALHPDAEAQLFSATRKAGVEELSTRLETWLEENSPEGDPG